MKKLTLHRITIVFLITLTACAPSPELLATQTATASTAIAAQWTKTATVTLTPTSTLTHTPKPTATLTSMATIAPSETPTPTEAPTFTLRYDFEQGYGLYNTFFHPQSAGKTYSIVTDKSGNHFFRGVVDLLNPVKTSDGHIRLYPQLLFNADGPYKVSLDVTIDPDYSSASPAELVSLISIMDQGPPNWNTPLTVDLVREGTNYYLYPHYISRDGKRTRGIKSANAIPFPFGEKVSLSTEVDKDGKISVLMSGEIISRSSMLPDEVKIRGAHFGLYSNDGVTKLIVDNDNIQVDVFKK